MFDERVHCSVCKLNRGKSKKRQTNVPVRLLLGWICDYPFRNFSTPTGSFKARNPGKEKVDELHVECL